MLNIETEFVRNTKKYEIDDVDDERFCRNAENEYENEFDVNSTKMKIN